MDFFFFKPRMDNVFPSAIFVMVLCLQKNIFVGKTVLDASIANSGNQSLNNFSHAYSEEVGLLNFRRKRKKTFREGK